MPRNSLCGSTGLFSAQPAANLFCPYAVGLKALLESATHAVFAEPALEQPLGDNIPLNFGFDKQLITKFDTRLGVEALRAGGGQPGGYFDFFIERRRLVVLNGEAIGHDEVAKVMAQNSLRFVENQCQSTTMRITGSSLVLFAQLVSEAHLALLFIEGRGYVKGVIVQRTARETVVMVQVLADKACFAVRAKHRLFFVSLGFFDAWDQDLASVVVATGSANAVWNAVRAAVGAGAQVRFTDCVVRTAFASARVGKSSLGNGHFG